MANFNKVLLLGNLTRDVELRYSQSGLPIAKLGMAVNRRYTQNGETKETTCFVDLTAFGKQAEILNQYMAKGRQLFVEGRLEYSTWESQDGGKRSKLEVVIENFQLLGGGRGAAGGGGGGGGGGGAKAKAAEAGAEGDVDYGDIPF
jgi:single-strand DNA-binding protein